MAKSSMDREKEYKMNGSELLNIYESLLIHDMSKILQNIKSSSELSSNLFGDPEKFGVIKELIETIKQQATRGFKLMDNVYRLSKLDKDQIAFHKIDVYNLLQNSIAFVELPIQENVQITIDCPFNEIFVEANDLLQDVFENLLINSVVHNQNLIIEILIRISKVVKDRTNFVKIEFIDNAIGICDERKIEIFKRKRSKQTGGKGMGFGLTLVKKLVDFYNGDIWIENNVKDDYSKGSNFIILMPEV